MSRAITPTEVLTLGLDATAVLLALVKLAAGRAALATTRRQVADLTGISPRRVGAAIATLHAAGLLRRTYGRRRARCWFRIFGLPTAVACGNGASTQRKRVARRCGTGAVPQGRIACGPAPRTQGRACGAISAPQAEKAACGIETDTQGRSCGIEADTQERAPVVSKRYHPFPKGKGTPRAHAAAREAGGRRTRRPAAEARRPPTDCPAIVACFEPPPPWGDPGRAWRRAALKALADAVGQRVVPAGQWWVAVDLCTPDNVEGGDGREAAAWGLIAALQRPNSLDCIAADPGMLIRFNGPDGPGWVSLAKTVRTLPDILGSHDLNELAGAVAELLERKPEQPPVRRHGLAGPTPPAERKRPAGTPANSD